MLSTTGSCVILTQEASLTHVVRFHIMSISGKRRQGHALTEFGPALFMFLIFFFVPIIDLGFIPVRYVIASGIVENLNKRMSMAEKMTDAENLLNTDGWRSQLGHFGIDVQTYGLSLKIISKANADDNVVVPLTSPITNDWLPDGSNCPCVYYLQLSVDTKISPLFTMNLPAVAVPGLTAPVPINLSTSAAWENFGRDPDNNQFYLNE